MVWYGRQYGQKRYGMAIKGTWQYADMDEIQGCGADDLQVVCEQGKPFWEAHKPKHGISDEHEG